MMMTTFVFALLFAHDELMIEDEEGEIQDFVHKVV